MLLSSVAACSAEVATSPSRGVKTSILTSLLAQLAAAEIRPVVCWLSGVLTQRQIGVGWAALRELPRPAPQPSLTVDGVQAQVTAIGLVAGTGSQRDRRRLLDELFGAATEAEQQFLRALLGGELRQGALGGVMTDAVARASGIGLPEIRRAAMLHGDLAEVATLALTGGPGALSEIGLQVGRPITPMLAQTASSVDDALERLGGRALFDAKLDGIRIQIHRDGDTVGLFTRTLDDVTQRLPEIVAAVRALPVRTLVADAEVLARHADGRPERFQVTAARIGSRQARSATPVYPFIFDILHLDGRDLIDEPITVRLAALDSVVPPGQRMPRLLTGDRLAASRFLDTVLAAGHEGVMAKSADACYDAGRRGAAWLKIKPVHTLDLVVLAVEWGSGRRTGKLSNVHLGARDGKGGYVMLGKTFKGMTDEMLSWQTARFLELATSPTDGWVVYLRPEQVVEIAFDGVQTSSRYPAGMALRFARVLRYRDDKTVGEADTVETVRAIHGV